MTYGGFWQVRFLCLKCEVRWTGKPGDDACWLCGETTEPEYMSGWPVHVYFPPAAEANRPG